MLDLYEAVRQVLSGNEICAKTSTCTWCAYVTGTGLNATDADRHLHQPAAPAAASKKAAASGAA